MKFKIKYKSKLILTSIIIFLLLCYSGAAQEQKNITAQDALAALDQAEQNMQEMKDAGFSVTWVNDTLFSTRQAFNQELPDYTLVLEFTDKIAVRKDRAYNISDFLTVLRVKIKRYENEGLEIKEADILFTQAATAFAEETYDAAEDLTTQTNEKLEEIKANAATLGAQLDAARRNIVTFMREQWWKLLLGSVIVLFAFLFVYDQVMRVRLHHRIEDAQTEQKVLVKLIKNAQDERYTKRTLSKKAYKAKVGRYKTRISMLRQTTPVLQGMLSRRLIPLAFIEEKLRRQKRKNT